MSASREKKNRQEEGNSPILSTRASRKDNEARSARAATVGFVLGAIVVLGFALGTLVWNSGIIQRKADAVTIDGQNYPAVDLAYYFYNDRANYLNNENSGIDASTNLRETYTASGETTWFDYITKEAAGNMAQAVRFANAAKAAGFNGGEELENSVQETLGSLNEAAASNGYNVNDYVKALFGSLMTRADFERNLRTATLAQLYANNLTDSDKFTDEQLQAAYDEDPDSFAMIDYEYALFFANADVAEDADDAAKDAAQEAALQEAQANGENAMNRFKAGESLEAVANELGGSYAHSKAYTKSGELGEWLYDSARRDGDVTMLDYYGTGAWVVVFHSKEKADFHPVTVRHILVKDEATAKDVLAQYEAGEKTEDAFAQLAKDNSTDNAEDGGLYTDVYLGQMVPPFEAWCFDASRKTGDTGIVQTDYGYHVMYFVEQNPKTYWQVQAANKLGSDLAEQVNQGDEPVILSGAQYIA